MNHFAQVDFQQNQAVSVGEAFFMALGQKHAMEDSRVEVDSDRFYNHFATSRGISVVDAKMTMIFEETADVLKTIKDFLQICIRPNNQTKEPIYYQMFINAGHSPQNMPVFLDLTSGPRRLNKDERAFGETVHEWDESKNKEATTFSPAARAVDFDMKIDICYLKEAKDRLNLELGNSGIRLVFAEPTIDMF